MSLKTLALSVTTVLLAAGAALAQPGHEGHDHAEGAHAAPAGVLPTLEQGIVPAIVTLVVFGVVLAILSVMVWPKISKGLADRENKIKGEIEAAEAARAQAKAALDQYEKSLADARVEAQKEIDKARQNAQLIAADLRAKADVELGAMREKAIREIDAAKKAALSEIYAESANLATAVAGKILKREVNSGDQQRLVQDALHEMKPVAARA